MDTRKTPRLLLRPLRPSDAPAFLEIFSDAETLQYWSGSPISSLSEAEALIEREQDLVNNSNVLTWGIALPENDRVIGKFTLFNFSEQNRRAELGYVLGRAHWRKGYMSEVMCAMLEYAFEERDLHRLEADTDPDNTASLALLEKYGFQREGYFRQRWLINDQWLDSVMLGLIRP